MIQMLPEYKRIFTLRLQGKDAGEICAIMDISQGTLTELTTREDFLQLQSILLEDLLGELRYDLALEARRACQEIDIVAKFRALAEDGSGTVPESVKLQALKYLAELGEMDRGKIEGDEELERMLGTMASEEAREEKTADA